MKYNVATFLGVVGVTTAATLVGVGEAQAILLIDDFSTNQLVVAPDQKTVGGGGIFGGFRGVDLSTAQAGTIKDSVLVEDGEFDFSAGSANGARTFRLVYAGNPGTALIGNPKASSVAPPVNFLAKGSGIKFGKAFGQFETLKVNLYNGGTGTATTSMSFTNHADAEDLFLSFGNFSKVAGSGTGEIDDILSNVKGVEAIFEISAASGSAANIGFEKIEVAAVPFEAETSAALLLLGGWGAWKYWKRNQQKVQIDATDEV